MNARERKALLRFALSVRRAIDINIGGERGRELNPSFGVLYAAASDLVDALESSSAKPESRRE
jgi:hypothetical protein